MSLKASRTPSKIDDNARVLGGVDDVYGHPWLGLVSLVIDCLHLLQGSNV